MINKNKFLFILLFLSACKAGQGTPSPAPSPTPSPIPHAFNVSFKPTNATKEESLVIRQAEKIISDTVKSECFKSYFTSQKLIQTEGRTPDQVVTHLRSLKGVVNVNMYYRCMSFGFRCLAPTSAVAFRDPPSTDINLNRAYFYTAMSPIEWASTMAHEALGHALGNYDHDYNPTDRRPYSIPYQLNEAIEKCATKTKI